MQLEFFMPMIPPTVTHQEKQVRVVSGKPRFYEPPELRDARQKLTAHLAAHRPERPLGGGLRLAVKWCFPRGRHGDGEYRTTRPDTDNLQKLLKDCMTAAGFWRDDAQVASEICEKFWTETPGIWLRVESLDQTCGSCRWWANDVEVCCNSDSAYCADFTDAEDSCPMWEGER